MGEQPFSFDDLQTFSRACLVRSGVPERDASWTTHVLLTADLQARPSHGISRLSAYIRGLELGKINPRAEVRLTRTGPSTALVNADNVLGPVAALAAIEAAISNVREAGIGAVGVHAANHAGAMGIYTSHIADAGLIGLAFTNAQPAIPPWGGSRAFFGTNPIAMSVGQGDHQITIDLATSIVARGNIIMAAKAGEAIPEGWALDKNGSPTTVAEEALMGAVLPMAGPKGYSLALMVEILCGVLTGAAMAPEVGSIYGEDDKIPNTGMFFLALSPDAFVGAEAFKARLEWMEDAIHGAALAEGADYIYLPGERRRKIAAERMSDGIPLGTDTTLELQALSESLGVPMPLVRSSKG